MHQTYKYTQNAVQPKFKLNYYPNHQSPNKVVEGETRLQTKKFIQKFNVIITHQSVAEINTLVHS